MTRWRLTKLLAIAAAGLAVAAGTVAAVAATTDDKDTANRAAAQEDGDDNAQPWLGVFVRPSDDPPDSRSGAPLRTALRPTPAWSAAT